MHGTVATPARDLHGSQAGMTGGIWFRNRTRNRTLNRTRMSGNWASDSAAGRELMGSDVGPGSECGRWESSTVGSTVRSTNRDPEGEQVDREGLGSAALRRAPHRAGMSPEKDDDAGTEADRWTIADDD